MNARTPLRILLSLLPFLSACGNGLYTDWPFASATTSTIEVVGTPIANGLVDNTVRIALRNADGEALSGIVPQFTASGFRNTVVQTCSATDSNGISTCPNAIGSTLAEAKALSLTSPISATVGSTTFAPLERGYNARACGLDLNHNGIPGEAADCRVCNANVPDPDGDGIDEDLIYVDSISGNDATGTGAATAPFKTLAAAMAATDGPGDGAEDILCLYGTFNESVSFSRSGVAGTTTLDGFQYPTHPFMLVGWDKDGDGAYPPVDTDDQAVIDGQNTLAWAFDLTTTAVARIEVAHLEVKRFQDPAASGGGMVRALNTVSHFHFHDLEVQEINDGLPDNNISSDRGAIVLPFNQSYAYFALRHIQFSKIGGNFLTVWNDSPTTHTHTLVQNVSVVTSTAPKYAELIQVRGVDNFRVEKSSFTADLSSGWNTTALDDYFTFFASYGCTTNTTVAENDIWGFASVLNIQFYLLDCTPSTRTDNFVFDSNYSVSGFASFDFITTANAIWGGSTDSTTNTLEDLRISNNFLHAGGLTAYSCMWLNTGNGAGPNVGVTTIVGNTCVGPFSTEGIALDDNTGGPALTFPEQDYRIFNNIIHLANPAATSFLRAKTMPSGLQAGGNVFSGTASWLWGGVTQASLAAWRTASGNQDLSSQVCTPAFVDEAGLDTHLASTDTCAADKGDDITAYTSRDYDGDTRPAVGSDAGADER